MLKTISILFFSIIINTIVYSQSVDKQTFYNAFSGESLEKIDAVLTSLEKAKSSDINNVYLAGLKMKKASLINSPIKKLNIFKEGKNLLETEISKYPINTEFRFIRLAIQEKAPDFLGYNTNLQEDKKIIVKNYSTIDNVLRKYILEYSKKSEILKTTDLK